MSLQAETLPAGAPPGGLDHAATWFWSFLKTELAPYPGRTWVVGRMTIAATIVMLVVMTFRLPSGFLGAIFTLFLSRENPTATLRAGVRIVVAFAVATAYSMVGIMILVDDPLTHFLWILATLFIAFYLIRIIPDYATAVAFGFMIAGAIPLWDETTLNVNTRVENTLWLAFSVLLGTAVTIAVEYVFRRVHPTTDLTLSIESRLQVVEDVLRNIAADLPPNDALEKSISLYESLGISRLRRLLVRSGYSPHFIAQMNAAVALLGRLVDLAASLRSFCVGHPSALSAVDRKRCEHLADRISILHRDFNRLQVSEKIAPPVSDEPSNLPFLSTMERTVALIPQTFSGSKSIEKFVVAPIDEEIRQRLLVPDAFSNPAHIQFAIRGMLAATTCYVLYTAVAWPGLSTSIATCIITALSTVGSSRQKQFLRLGGAILGGIIFGMGAQIFVLPYLDSIAGFTVLFAVVTAISAWIGTATPRLSYLGVQLALAFYLINMQEFAIQISLSIARDRVFGVLLGLMSMWLIFDRLWVRDALDEMQAIFSRNLELMAELAEQLLTEDRNEAVQRVRQLRDQINAGFQAVNEQADAVLFEFGPSREHKLKVREDIKRWQPSLRTLLLVQITSSQYRIEKPLIELPEAIAAAHIAFEKDIAHVMRAMADEISGKALETGPDIQASAMNLQQEIRKYYEGRGLPISTQASDVIRLTEDLASILAPLYEDIRATFANAPAGMRGLSQYKQQEA
ncbi:MAG TPA: FUSC family protein [Acidobacteriaceae bacterium]|jgi:multidrug resistance protein MdtO|nr:FUSC family protein [Acidobacteriaceae bacterium]